MTKVVFPLSVSIVFCATISVCLQSLSSLFFVLVLRAGSEFARVGSSLLSVRFYVCLGYDAVSRKVHHFSICCGHFFWQSAIDAVVERVMGAPFRPDFAIVFAGQKFSLSRISTLVSTSPCLFLFFSAISPHPLLFHLKIETST